MCFLYNYFRLEFAEIWIILLSTNTFLTFKQITMITCNCNLENFTSFSRNCIRWHIILFCESDYENYLPFFVRYFTFYVLIDLSFCTFISEESDCGSSESPNFYCKIHVKLKKLSYNLRFNQCVTMKISIVTPMQPMCNWKNANCNSSATHM